MTTPLERNSCLTKDFIEIAKTWNSEIEKVIFRSVWGGFDKLQAEDFRISREDEYIEVSISQAAIYRIEDYIFEKNPRSRLRLHPEPIEVGKTKRRGQPPRSDIGFRLIAGGFCSHLTLEAKIIDPDSAVSKYVTEITDNFLTGRYSKYSSIGGMLGYLMSGDVENAFSAISKSLSNSLSPHPDFLERNHKVSKHTRNLASGIGGDFTCHHLIIKFCYTDEETP